MNWLSHWKHYWSTELFKPRYEGEKPLSSDHIRTSCRRSDDNRKTHVSWRAWSLKYRGILPNICKMIGNQSQIPSHTFPVTKAWNRKRWPCCLKVTLNVQRSKYPVPTSLFSSFTSKVTLHKNATHNHKTWPKKKIFAETQNWTFELLEHYNGQAEHFRAYLGIFFRGQLWDTVRDNE